MEVVAVAFESDKSCNRIKEILESGGVAACIVCRSAAEVKRAVYQQRITTVICGYKFPDGSAEALFEDLPDGCSMLMMAMQSLLNLCANEDIFKLAIPAARSDLLFTVRMLLQMGRRLGQFAWPHRSEGEEDQISQAKRLLMERRSITEEQAHRFLQKRSMDTGAKLTQIARQVLEDV